MDSLFLLLPHSRFFFFFCLHKDGKRVDGCGCRRSVNSCIPGTGIWKGKVTIVFCTLLKFISHQFMFQSVIYAMDSTLPHVVCVLIFCKENKHDNNSPIH